MLSDKAVIEYMEIYRLEYGKDINIEAARKQATNLLKLIKLISTPSAPLNGLIIDKQGKYENN